MQSEPHLNLLESTGLIRRAQLEPDLEYLFKHALVQDAAYESILRQDRRSLHRAVGEALEHLYPERLTSQDLASVLGEHFERAGDAARAIQYFTQAGDAAAKGYANIEALQHFTRALALIRSTPVTPETRRHLYSQRGNIMQLNGQYAEVIDHYAAMRAVAQTEKDPILELAALSALASIYATPSPLHNPATARKLALEALEITREQNDREEESKILWNLLLACMFGGQLQEAVEYGERSLAIARQMGLRNQLAFTLNDISRAYTGIGQVNKAEESLAEARSLWREFDNLPMLADSLGASGENMTLMGQYQRVLEYTAQGYAISAAINNRWGQDYTRWVSAYGYIELGELDKGYEIFLALLGNDTTTFSFVRFAGQLELTVIAAGLHLHDRAQAHYLQARSEFRDFDPTLFEFYFEAVYARLLVARGDLAEAEAVLTRAQVHDQSDNFMSSALYHAALAHCELSMAQGRFEQVIAAADRYVERIRQYGIAYGEIEMLGVKGTAQLESGRLDEAASTLHQARALAEAQIARRQLGPVLISLYRVQKEKGNETAARAARDEARTLLQFLADHHPPDLRSHYLALPDVRLILGSDSTP